MKKILNILLPAFLVICSTGCNSDMKYKEYGVTAVTELLAPTSDFYLELEPGEGKYVTFRWDPARTENGLLPMYELIFYPSAQGGEVYRIDAGMQNSTRVSHKIMNRVATAAGIEADSDGEVYWSVVANNGIVEALPTERRRLVMSSLSGFSYIPETLYITGSATEAEDLGMELIPLKAIDDEDGEFEIYTRLDANGSYNFVGDNDQYYSFANRIMTESTTPIIPEESGIYRIKIDMTTKSISWTRITKLTFNFPMREGDMSEEMPYIGNGIWKLTDKFLDLPQEDWGLEERFSFQAEVTGELHDKEIWGSEKSDNTRPTVLTGDFWNVYITPYGGDMFAHCWKFTEECAGRTADITLYMSPSVEKYHVEVDLK